MKNDFYTEVLERHQNVEPIPSNEEITGWAVHLIRLMFPEKQKINFTKTDQIRKAFAHSKKELLHIMNITKACKDCNNEEVIQEFFNSLPAIYELLCKDARAILEGDPAAVNEFEVIRTYPGFYAICFYRIAHQLLQCKVPLIPRILTEFAHSKTGIDIHPGAKIGAYFFIDHGTGIVIGETTKIGKNVKLYQGVNLGALSVAKNMQSQKRHPTVEDGVIIYSGATILGGNTVIGAHSIIGGNVWLVKSVPPHSKVYHKPDIQVIENKKEHH